MSEWREYLLSDLIYTNTSTVTKGYQFEKILYLDTGSIICNKIESLQEFSINDAPSRAKRLVDNDDIVYSSVRPNQLHYGFIKNPPQNLVVSTGFVVIKCKKEILHPKFLYYYITQSSITEFLHSIAEGSTSTYPSLKPDDIHELDILLPPLPEQERIAEVLSSLDDKIDLLHRNNKTLEQLAETLFRQWFVEEAEDSWEEVKLGRYVNLVSGYSYRSVDLKSSTKALVTLKNFDRTGGFRHDGFKEYTGKYKDDQVVVSGDLIVAHTDITQEAEVLGNPALVISTDKYETLIISTDLVKVVPISYLTKVYLYFLMKSDEFKHYCLGASNGTTVLHLSKKALPEYDFKLPSAELVERFTVIAEPLLEKININQKHIQQLETLRDTLLPKLMSGVVRVEN